MGLPVKDRLERESSLGGVVHRVGVPVAVVQPRAVHVVKVKALLAVVGVFLIGILVRGVLSIELISA